jgi:hypothetical protein
MTRQITSGSPKRFLSPTTGYTKYSTVYLGDPYNTTLTAVANSGDTTVSLADVSEFLAAGTATIGTQTITYTGITGFELTGVSGITSTATVGTVVTPIEQWEDDPITIYPEGSEALVLNVSLRLTGQSSFSFPGMPLILSSSSLAFGNPMGIDVQITVPPITVGVSNQSEFFQWGIGAGPFFQTNIGGGSPGPGTVTITAIMAGYVNRADQALPTPIRVLPLNRQIQNPLGFVIGEYTWRDSTEINSQTVIPTNWETDPTKMNSELFIAGIGAGSDLEPVGFTQDNNSIYLQINRGFYYTGPKGYYLPAQPELDQQSTTELIFSPTNLPTLTLPIFVGNYILDSQGFYEWNDVYRYTTQAAISRSIANNTPLPEYYFTWNRGAEQFTLNASLPNKTLYIGAISGEVTDYYNIPIYPIETILSIYVLQSTNNTIPVASNLWSYDPDFGTITITNPSGNGPSVPGAIEGEPVIIVCIPAVAVLFDTTDNPIRTLDTIDLNPAFSGISGGIVYLQQSREEVENIVLSCDKPIIQIPPTFASIVGLVAYGPVYFNGDYALLQATAYTDVSGEVVQAASLEVVVDPSTFSGTINYLDPTAETVIVTTGADGIANMIYRPASNYGYWIPTTSPSGGLAGITTTNVANDTLVLPAPLAISQLYDSLEVQPFLITTYSVLNNNPIFGKVGADTLAGEVPFTTSGTAGTATYKTNGQLSAFLSTSNLLYPISMLDSSGNNYLAGGFSGEVVQLVYNQALPTGGTIGAYFVTFIQRILIRMKDTKSNVQSNSILLQMQMPLPINDNVWLILNDQNNGILNQYRLGNTPQN